METALLGGMAILGALLCTLVVVFLYYYIWEMFE